MRATTGSTITQVQAAASSAPRAMPQPCGWSRGSSSPRPWRVIRCHASSAWSSARRCDHRPPRSPPPLQRLGPLMWLWSSWASLLTRRRKARTRPPCRCPVIRMRSSRRSRTRRGVPWSSSTPPHPCSCPGSLMSMLSCSPVSPVRKQGMRSRLRSWVMCCRRVVWSLPSPRAIIADRRGAPRLDGVSWSMPKELRSAIAAGSGVRRRRPSGSGTGWGSPRGSTWRPRSCDRPMGGSMRLTPRCATPADLPGGAT